MAGGPSRGWGQLSSLAVGLRCSRAVDGQPFWGSSGLFATTLLTGVPCVNLNILRAGGVKDGAVNQMSFNGGCVVLWPELTITPLAAMSAAGFPWICSKVTLPGYVLHEFLNLSEALFPFILCEFSYRTYRELLFCRTTFFPPSPQDSLQQLFNLFLSYGELAVYNLQHILLNLISLLYSTWCTHHSSLLLFCIISECFSPYNVVFVCWWSRPHKKVSLSLIP